MCITKNRPTKPFLPFFFFLINRQKFKKMEMYSCSSWRAYTWKINILPLKQRYWTSRTNTWQLGGEPCTDLAVLCMEMAMCHQIYWESLSLMWERCRTFRKLPAAAAGGRHGVVACVLGGCPGYCLVCYWLGFTVVCLWMNQLTSTALIPSKFLSWVWDNKKWLNLN